MIRRHVFEKMCAAYSSLQFFREHSHDALAGSPKSLCAVRVHDRSGKRTYLSEDFAFCKRWTDMGGEIWPISRAVSITSDLRYSRAISRRSSRRRCPPPMRRKMLAAADRMGVAQLARMSAGGIDLHPLWQVLINKLLGGTIEPGEGMDLSLIAQLLGGQGSRSRDPAGDAGVASIIPLALFLAHAAIARIGARGGDRHGWQHADRVPAGGIRHRIDDALCCAGYGTARAAARSRRRHRDRIRLRGLSRRAGQDYRGCSAMAAAAAQCAASRRQISIATSCIGVSAGSRGLSFPAPRRSRAAQLIGAVSCGARAL